VAGVDRGGGSGGVVVVVEGEEFVVERGVVDGEIPAERAVGAAGAEFEGGGGLGAARRGEGEGFAEGRRFVAGGEVGVELESGGVVAEAEFGHEAVVGEGVVGRGAEGLVALASVGGGAGAEDEREAGREGELVFDVGLEVGGGLGGGGDERGAVAGGVGVVGGLGFAAVQEEAGVEAVGFGGVDGGGAEKDVVGELVDDLGDGVIEVLVGPGGAEIPGGVAGAHGGFAGEAEEVEVAFLVEGEVGGIGLGGVGAELGFCEAAGEFGVGANGGEEEAGFGGGGVAEAEVGEEAVVLLAGVVAEAVL